MNCSRNPNILIAGTPGTGKSTLGEEIAHKTGLLHVDVSHFAKDNGLTEGWDEDRQCDILDEDRVIDELEEKVKNGGYIIDYHGAEWFPERWFDIVFVLRTDNTVLYDRLEKRGYSDQKIKENVECEIFQTILEEARDSYNPDIVHELSSNTPEEMENNTEQITQWLDHWRNDNQNT